MSDFWDYTETDIKEQEKKLPLTWDRLRKICFHLWRQFDDQYYAGFAAQIAYFFFMSSVPMLIVLTQVLGIFDVSMDFVKDWLESHLSTEMGSVLVRLFSASSTAVTNVAMIILALWASSSLAFSLSRLTTYTISYTVDGVVVATETLAEGQVPTPPATATKTGYTFTGWSDVPATMPAEDVTVTALFTVNSYTLTYMVDGEVYGTPETVAYGTVITPKAEPTKEGYTFTGWQNVPATMPAQDVVISGMFNKDKAYTTFAVGISGYATFCSTKALRFVGNEAVKAYIAKSKNSNVVVLQQVIGSVAAGTGLVLKGSANATATIEEVETGSTYNNNLLVGVTSGSVTINAANKYVLVVKNGVVKFADTDGREAVVPAGKSYLQVNASARELTFEFEDDTTGIDAADNENQVDGSIYNLRGVRVEKPPGKGLYIINGKKVFIK